MQRDRGGPVGVYGCHGLTTQRWRMMKDGVISNGVSCIVHHVLSPGTCNAGDNWALREDGSLRLARLPNSCLTLDSATGMAGLESCATPVAAVCRGLLFRPRGGGGSFADAGPFIFFLFSFGRHPRPAVSTPHIWHSEPAVDRDGG